MKNKYYFNSIGVSLLQFFIALSLSGVIAVCFIADEFYLEFVIVLTLVTAIFLFWAFFSFTMRIEIDKAKKEIYIKHPYLIKRLKFEEVTDIRITKQNDVELVFIISTNKFSREIVYARYYKNKPSLKVKTIINNLKSDLLFITT